MVGSRAKVLDLMKGLMNLMVIHVWYLSLMTKEYMTIAAVNYRKERGMNPHMRREN